MPAEFSRSVCGDSLNHAAPIGRSRGYR